MQRIAIAILVVLELAAAGCKKKNDGEARTGSGSVAAGSETAGGAAGSGRETQPTAGSGSDTGSAATAGSGSDTGSAVATGSGSAGAAGSNSLPDCDALIAAVDKIATCDQLKPKADAIRQTADIMRKLVPDILRSGDAKKIARIASECKTNLDVIKASGCPL